MAFINGIFSIGYEQCFVSQLGLIAGQCGPYNRWKLEGMYPFKNLKCPEQTKSKLCEIFKYRSYDLINFGELELICNRLGITITAAQKYKYTCAQHRFHFGFEWRPSKLCQFPDGCKNKASICCSIPIMMKIWDASGSGFKLGSSLCSKHRLMSALPCFKLETSDDENDENFEDVSSSTLLDDKEYDEQRDFSFSTAPELFDMTPPKYQLHTKYGDVGERVKRDLKRKFSQFQNKSETSYLESIAPGQGKKLRDILNSSLEESNDAPIPIDLQPLVTAFKSALSVKSKRLILSIVPESYTKQQVIDYFDCKMNDVDSARKIATTIGPAGIKSNTPQKRQSFNINQAYHFIDYLFDVEVLQDVAYGTQILKFNDGDKTAYWLNTFRKIYTTFMQTLYTYIQHLCRCYTPIYNIYTDVSPISLV